MTLRTLARINNRIRLASFVTTLGALLCSRILKRLSVGKENKSLQSKKFKEGVIPILSKLVFGTEVGAIQSTVEVIYKRLVFCQDIHLFHEVILYATRE